MRRLRALAVGLGIVVGLGLPVAGAPGSALEPLVACAVDTGPRAVLVVVDGSGARRFCVALDAATVTGIHLVELASAQHGLSYSLGFGRQAICQLNGVGPAGGDCFADYPDFWGYWHGTTSGGWTWANGGAATFRVGDGDVEGWVWGSGDSGSTHRSPPVTRADDVCPPPAPDPIPQPDPPSDGTGNGDPGAGGTGGNPTATATPSPRSSASLAPTDGKEEREGERRRERERDPSPTVEPSTSPEAADLRATGATLPEDGGGPPVGLLIAVVLGAALGAAGWWRARRSGGAA